MKQPAKRSLPPTKAMNGPSLLIQKNKKNLEDGG